MVLHDQAWLTDMRTAAAGAVAAKHLAPSKVDCIGIVGTGVQAARSVLDPLYAKAVVFESGGRKLCIVSLDTTMVLPFDTLTEPDEPALIHGDVWTTNVLAQDDRITGFLDPAIYYADPEIELAFITLFNTFGQPFFQRYHELRPKYFCKEIRYNPRI